MDMYSVLHQLLSISGEALDRMNDDDRQEGPWEAILRKLRAFYKNALTLSSQIRLSQESHEFFWPSPNSQFDCETMIGWEGQETPRANTRIQHTVFPGITVFDDTNMKPSEKRNRSEGRGANGTVLSKAVVVI